MTGLVNFLSGYHTTSGDMKKKIVSNGVSWTLSKKYTSADLSEHFRLRDAILNQVYKEGRITFDQFHRIKDFRVSYEDQLIEFTIPGTNHTVTVEFESVTDKAAISALNYLIGRVNTELFYGRVVPMIGSSKPKSNADGPAPLQRKSAAAKALPTDFAKLRQTVVPEMLAKTPSVASDRQKIVKRIEHAELIAHRMKIDIADKIQLKSKQVQNLENIHPQPRDAGCQIAVLNGEIQEFQELQQQFETLDTYALSMALTALPVGRYHYDQLEGATKLIQQQVRAHLEGHLKQSKIPFAGEKTLDATDEAYIKGVAGLLHKSRGEYAVYCEKQRMQPERETLEDLILREALRHSDGLEFDESEIKGAAAVHGITTPELQTEVAKMFDYYDRLHGVNAYFPKETRSYTGNDSTALSGQIASRHNAINMNGRNAPARQHRVFNMRNGAAAAVVCGAIVAGESMGLEPVRRISNLGQMVLSNPRGAVGNLVMGVTGLVHVKRYWDSRDQLPYLIAGGTLLTGLAMQALGTMDPTAVFQVAAENPAYSVALLATAREAAKLAYDYVRPQTGPETGLYSVSQREMKWGRAAIVLAAGAALAVGGSAFYQAMSSEDEEERNQALGYLAGVIDSVWNHCAIASITLPFARKAIESKVGGTVGRVISGTMGILENVAKVSSGYHFALGAWDKVNGYFSWSSKPMLPELPAPDTEPTGPLLKELTENGPVELPRISPSSLALPDSSDVGVEYTINGKNVCRNPLLVNAIPEMLTQTVGGSGSTLGSKLWNGTVWIATESMKAANQTDTGKMFARVFRPAFN